MDESDHGDVLNEIDSGGGVIELHLLSLWEVADPRPIRIDSDDPTLLHVESTPLWRTPVTELVPTTRWSVPVGSRTHAAGEHTRIIYVALPTDLEATITGWLRAAMEAGASLSAFVLGEFLEADVRRELAWLVSDAYATAWKGEILVELDEELRTDPDWTRHIDSIREMRLPVFGPPVRNAGADPDLIPSSDTDPIDAMRVIPTLLEVCPSFRPIWDVSEEENSGHRAKAEEEAPRVITSRLHYTDVGDFAAHMVDLMQRNELAELPAVGHAVERLLRDGDHDTSTLVVVGLLEDLQNLMISRGIPESVMRPHLGRDSAGAWRSLNSFWTGSPTFDPDYVPYPGDYVTLLQEGQEELSAGRHGEARNRVLRAIRIRPERPEAHEMLLEIEALTPPSLPPEPAAEPEREPNPKADHWEDLLALASEDLRAGRNMSARDHCLRAIELAPTKSDAHRLLSIAAQELDDMATAQAEARTAVSLAPRSAMAHWQMVDLAATLDEFDDAAVASIDELGMLGADDTDIRALLARIADLPDQPTAAQHAAAALERAPGLAKPASSIQRSAAQTQAADPAPEPELVGDAYEELLRRVVTTPRREATQASASTTRQSVDPDPRADDEDDPMLAPPESPPWSGLKSALRAVAVAIAVLLGALVVLLAVPQSFPLVLGAVIAFFVRRARQW